MQVSIVLLLRVQCRRKESSRSLSHLLMSFLYFTLIESTENTILEHGGPNVEARKHRTSI